MTCYLLGVVLELSRRKWSAVIHDAGCLNGPESDNGSLLSNRYISALPFTDNLIDAWEGDISWCHILNISGTGIEWNWSGRTSP